MKSLLRRSAVLLGASLALSTLSFASTLFIYPSIGPGWSSPNGATYEANAAAAIQAGFITGGIAGTPGYYSQVAGSGPVSAYALISTDDGAGNFFNSWMGNTSPTGNYSGEFGNSLYFGLRIESPGQAFTLANVGFTGDTVIGESLAGVVFSSHTIGCVDALCVTYYDGSAGHTGDDTTSINYLFTSGFSIYGLAGDIPTLNATFNAFSGQSVSQKYTLSLYGNESTLQTVNIASVPEPGTIVLFGIGLSALIVARKRSLNRG